MGLVRLVTALSLYVISCNAAEPVMLITYAEHPAAVALIPMIKQSYKDIGYNAEFVQAPLTRRLHMLEHGQSDADLGARSTASLKYPSIIKVGPRLSIGTLLLICRHDKLCAEDILKNPKIVVYTESSSWELLEDIYSKQLKVKRGTLQNAKTPIEMFIKGRADYIVTTSIGGTVIPVTGQKYSSVKLATVEYFHHIQAKHKNLAPALDKSLSKNIK